MVAKKVTILFLHTILNKLKANADQGYLMSSVLIPELAL